MTTKLRSLAEKIGVSLQAQNFLLATAESCTGGGLSYAITAIPGSSDWFDRGFVTYSNAAKIDMLGVEANTLGQYGAVSMEAAREMAEGALLNSLADVSIAVTGIAGPDGGTEEKPVGTVWIAWSKRAASTVTQVFLFKGDRGKIREQTMVEALAGLLKILSSKS